MEDLLDKLDLFGGKFRNDEEVKSLIGKLKARFEDIQSQVFTDGDFDSEEFPDMVESYYMQARENDPDDIDIFDVLWFGS